MIVELIPCYTPAKPVTHGGQEFNMVLEGRMKMIIGNHQFILETGDSIYFDPNIPHAQHPDGVPARFLTVIQ
jgi:mannose-6-phosphate isomerase-like protein (cupin superfamily)